MKELCLQAHPNKTLRLARGWASEDITHCEILLELETGSFRGNSSAVIDAQQWTDFLNQFDSVANGERQSAELHARRAGLSLQIVDRGDADSVVLICTLSHPGFLDAETAIYATGAEFQVSKQELRDWLHEADQKNVG